MVSCDKLDGECPTCGESFDSCIGVKTHHKLVHGESIKGVEIQCEYCGETVWKRQKKKRNEHEFCSKECYHKWQSEELSGENSHAYGGGKNTYTCKHCGDEFERYPSQINGEHNFCSNDCKNEWMEEAYKGENNHQYKGEELEVECDWCGETTRKSKYKLERDERHFCSDGCYRNWRSKNIRGENHPRWEENSDRINYGGSWPRQREKRLEKDGYECVVCGKSNEQEKEEHNRGLSVHHITKAKEFLQEDGTLDEKEAHKIENLISLCHNCHLRWEGVPLRPQKT